MNSAAPLRPPFDLEKAVAKVRAAENAWNSRDAQRVSLAYSEDSTWRNRDRFIRGRDEIVQFLTSKWQRELDYRLVKELWTFSENRIAFASSMSGMMTSPVGSEAMATNCGSLMMTA